MQWNMMLLEGDFLERISNEVYENNQQEEGISIIIGIKLGKCDDLPIIEFLLYTTKVTLELGQPIDYKLLYVIETKSIFEQFLDSNNEYYRIWENAINECLKEIAKRFPLNKIYISKEASDFLCISREDY